MLKICTKCQKEKPHNDFALKRTGVNSVCKSCKKVYNKTWYLKNLEKHKNTVRVNNDKYHEEMKRMIDSIKSNPCSDCGETFHVVAMDFDHINNDKKHDISRMLRNRQHASKILEEIAKCELVCSNCHRIRTYHRTLAVRSNHIKLIS